MPGSNDLEPQQRSSRSTSQRAQAYLLLSALHVLPIVALCVSRPTAQDAWAFAVLYATGAFGVGVGLHRYFAHRSFRTPRWFQFVMGWLSSTTFTDPIGFAGKHRIHHRTADGPGDVHGPRTGFWFSWIGSLVDHGYSPDAISRATPDLNRYPELVWLQRYSWVAASSTALAAWLYGGFGSLALGFCLSRVVIIHSTSAVNYLCHRGNARPFPTNDRSTNRPIIALFTLGEGWHNNHHYYPAAARAGFHWWQPDPLYWCIRALAVVGLAWDVKEVPESVLAAERALLPTI